MDKRNLYRKKECEICGKQTFEKFIETTNVLDGGFTEINTWENSGVGYIVINLWELDESLKEFGRMQFEVCSDCTRKILKAIHTVTKKETEDKQ